MLHRALLLVALLAVGACSSQGGSEAELVADAQTAVRGLLKDPESARFSTGEGTMIYPEAGVICFGLVNAKNGFGGYTGAQAYFYSRKHGAAIAEGDNGLWREIAKECLAATDKRLQDAK